MRMVSSRQHRRESFLCKGFSFFVLATIILSATKCLPTFGLQHCYVKNQDWCSAENRIRRCRWQRLYVSNHFISSKNEILQRHKSPIWNRLEPTKVVWHCFYQNSWHYVHLTNDGWRMAHQWNEAFCAILHYTESTYRVLPHGKELANSILAHP